MILRCRLCGHHTMPKVEMEFANELKTAIAQVASSTTITLMHSQTSSTMPNLTLNPEQFTRRSRLLWSERREVEIDEVSLSSSVDSRCPDCFQCCKQADVRRASGGLCGHRRDEIKDSKASGWAIKRMCAEDDCNVAIPAFTLHAFHLCTNQLATKAYHKQVSGAEITMSVLEPAAMMVKCDLRQPLARNDELCDMTLLLTLMVFQLQRNVPQHHWSVRQ